MADGEAVIRLDADVSAYINKVVRAQKETKEAAKGFGNELSKAFDNAVKGAAILGMTKMLLDKSAQAAKEYADNMARASTEAGKAAVSEANIMGRMGVGKGAARGLLSDETALATKDQKLAFLGKIADLQEQRRAAYLPQLKAQEVGGLTEMFAQGGEAAFGAGGGDLIKGVQGMPAGVPVAQSMKRMLAGRLGLKGAKAQDIPLDEMFRRYMRTIPQEAMQEQGIQVEEDLELQEKNVAAGESGKRARILKAREDRKMTNPLYAAVRRLPFVEQAADLESAAMIDTGGLSGFSVPGTASGNRDQGGVLNVLQSIDRSMKSSLKPNLPNLNARAPDQEQTR